jgi:hypothetical protein
MERSVDDSGRRAGYSLKPTTKSEHLQTSHVVPSRAGCFAIPMSCKTGFGSSSDPTADTGPIRRLDRCSLARWRPSASNAHDIINRLSAAVCTWPTFAGLEGSRPHEGCWYLRDTLQQQPTEILPHMSVVMMACMLMVWCCKA